MANLSLAMGREASSERTFYSGALKAYRDSQSVNELISLYSKSILRYEEIHEVTENPFLIPTKEFTLEILRDADITAIMGEKLLSDVVTATCLIFIKHNMNYTQMVKLFISANERITFDSFIEVVKRGDKKTKNYVRKVWVENFSNLLKNANNNSLCFLLDSKIEDRAFWVELIQGSLIEHTKNGSIRLKALMSIKDWLPEIADKVFLSALEIAASYGQFRISDILQQMQTYMKEHDVKFDLTTIWRKLLAKEKHDTIECGRILDALLAFGVTKEEIENYVYCYK